MLFEYIMVFNYVVLVVLDNVLFVDVVILFCLGMMVLIVFDKL